MIKTSFIKNTFKEYECFKIVEVNNENTLLDEENISNAFNLKLSITNNNSINKVVDNGELILLTKTVIQEVEDGVLQLKKGDLIKVDGDLYKVIQKDNFLDRIIQYIIQERI